MWMNNGKNNFPGRGFSTPPPSWRSRPFRSPKTAPFLDRKRSSPNSANKSDLFHVIHKIPAGDSPYVKAKQVQLIDKDPSRAVSLFWAAINAGDRVDSALKDMAVVMKQLDRSDEAIEAIRSFRHLCSYDSQESIDNVLIELYKRSGRIEEEIDMLRCKLKQIEDGTVFGGKKTKAARSQGKKVQITVEQEKSRVLGNLAWAFLQQDNVDVAEEYYRKALCLETDNNKQCNLAICLILMNRLPEAKSMLQSIRASSGGTAMEESYAKSFERASHMLAEKESKLFNSSELEEGNSTTVRAGTCVPQLTSSMRWTRDDEEMYVNENSRDDHQWNRHENESFGWSEDCFSENLGKSSSCISIKMKENRNRNRDRDQDGLLRLVDEGVNCCSLYSSPTRAKRHVEVPFTQVKNSLWEFNNRCQPNETRQRKRTSSSSRKVLFDPDQSFDNGFAVDASSESERSGPTSNYMSKYRSAASDAVELEVPFTQPRSCSWGINGGDRQQKTSECFRSLLSSSSSRKLSFEPHTSTENTQALTCSSFGRSELSRAVSDEDVEYEERAMPYDSMKIQKEHKHNSSAVGGKKSWADMVEEEEEEDDGDNEKEDDTEETSSSERARVNYYNDRGSSSDNEELKFNDENLNSNILHQKNHSPPSSNHVEDGAKDSVDVVSSRNPAVRRPLCFDQQPMLESADNRRSSPLPKKDFTTEDEENVKLIRRNRLQIFQEITVHQELS